MKKLAVFCLPGLDTFVRDVAQDLTSIAEVRICASVQPKEIEPILAWAEIVWIEFANELAVSMIHPQVLKPDQYAIVRLHSYEALSGFHHQIRWDRVNKLVFVAENIRDIVMDEADQIQVNWKQPPDNRVSVPFTVIPNGVKLDRYPFKKREKNHELAFVGNISSKKGIMLLMHAFRHLVGQDSKYRLHLAGRIDEPRFGMYISHATRMLGLENSVVYHGFVPDVPGFLQDKSHILCTSPIESQNMGVMEAMAMGLKPVVHNFIGADTIYDSSFLWNMIDEFTEEVIYGEFDSEKYRKFVEDRYAFNDTQKKVRQLIHNIPKPKPYDVFSYWGKREYPTDPSMPQSTTAAHIDYIRDNVEPGSRVLEIGPGLGRTFQAYQGKDLSFFSCMDVTDRYKEEMFKQADKYIGREPEFFQMKPEDKFRLPWAGNEFDVAVVSEVFLHQRPENIVRMMSEACRVAKKVVAISWMEHSQPYLEPGTPVDGKTHCYHYNYPQICIKNGWNVFNIIYLNRQIFFCYEREN